MPESQGLVRVTLRLAMCPICFSLVENEPVAKFEGAALLCPNHGQFKITKQALQAFAGNRAAEWEAHLVCAKEKAAPGRFPTIDLV